MRTSHMQYQVTIVHHHRSKHIRLSIQSDGSLRVSAPNSVSHAKIQQFIASQQNWIKKQVQKQANTLTLETDQYVYIFGKKYQKELSSPPKHPLGVFIQDQTLVISTLQIRRGPLTKQEKHDSRIQRFLKKTARHYITQRTQYQAKKMNLTFGTITLRKQKTRWGSCSSDGNLSFNWQLVHFEPKIIDYVIIHELAHRVHMNHSAQFWALVAKYDGNYKQHMSVLKKYTLG